MSQNLSALEETVMSMYLNSKVNAAKKKTPNNVTPANAPWRANVKRTFRYSNPACPETSGDIESFVIRSHIDQTNIVNAESNAVVRPTAKRLPCGTSGTNIGKLQMIEMVKTH